MVVATAASGSSPRPWAFHVHGAAWAVVAGIGLLYVLLLSRSAKTVQARVALRQWAYLSCALVALAAAATWPVADVAAHWSLTALIGQRLLLTLAAAPLLLLALPVPVLARVTRPALVDDVLAFVTRPVVAVITFSAIAIGTLLPGAVSAQSSSGWARAAVDVALLLGGFVLWMPVIGRVPGACRLTFLGAAVYLFVQSLIPTFPAVVYIFSNHVLYPEFAAAHQAIGISALGDQHLAGIVAKIATLPVLWTVAWVTLARGQDAETRSRDPYPLTWAEVERQLERAERAEHSPRKTRRPRARAIPRPVAGGWSSFDERQRRSGA